MSNLGTDLKWSLKLNLQTIFQLSENHRIKFTYSTSAARLELQQAEFKCTVHSGRYQTQSLDVRLSLFLKEGWGDEDIKTPN